MIRVNAFTNMLVSVAQMQDLERRADAIGHAYATMMELAGKSVADIAISRFFSPSRSAELTSKPCLPLAHVACLVLVGPGNNGGDGLVCARYLHQAGIPVRVYLWKRRSDPAHDYEQHFAKLSNLGVATQHADADPDLAILRTWLAESSVIIDALLGTGNNRAIEGQLAEILSQVATWQRDNVAQSDEQSPALRSQVSDLLPAIRNSQRATLSLDCPSGLNCDTGEVDPHTLPADITVTFAHAKRGHYLFPGADLCGEIIVTDIGIPTQLEIGSQMFVLSVDLVRPWLPARPRLSHKGTFGKLMAAVGCERYPGAAYLSLAAAGRVGAGLITGAVVRSVQSISATKLAEPTWLPLPDDDGFLNAAAAQIVATSLASYNTLLLGCGLGNTKSTQAFVATLLPAIRNSQFVILDADALNCLAQLDSWHVLLPPNSVITPHPAEMARLCQSSVDEVVRNRWELAREKAAEWNCVVLLKGPYTVIADPSGNLAVLPIATPALATAGTGDVLAGTIAGLLAQGIEPFRATCLGAWLHGQAGLRCAAEIGRAGVIASDLIGRLPQIIEGLSGAPI